MKHKQKQKISQQTKQFKKSLGFIDQIDLAFDKGTIRKSHPCINENLSIINYYPLSHKDQSLPTFERSYRRKCFISAKQQTTLSLYTLEQHLFNGKYLYYTNNPVSDSILVCLDFDCINKDCSVLEDNRIKALNQLSDYLSFYFPNCFYDNGSSGKSLNFYIFIDISSDRDDYFFDGSNNQSFACYVNSKLSDLSKKLESIFNGSNSPIDNRYYCFDSIKATISDYDYVTKKNKTYYNSIKKSGMLAKLPCPISDKDYNLFYCKKLYELGEIEEIINNLYSDSVDYSVHCIQTPFECVSAEPAHVLLFPLSQKENWEIETTEDKELNTINTIDMTGQTEGTEEDKNYKNYYTILVMSAHSIEESIKQEKNAGIRSLKALRYLTGLYLNNNQDLSIEDYRQEYRTLFGTNEEDSGDVKRLTYIYNKYYITIKEQLENYITYKIQYLVGELKKQTTEEDIQKLQKTYTKYDRRIYLEDIASAALSFYSLLSDKKYIEFKQWSNKEDTVPMTAVRLYLNKLQELGIIKNKCNKHKITAIRIILENLNWIKIVDPDSDFIKHISMRYILCEKHPYYQQYLNVVGKETIEKYEKSEIENTIIYKSA